MFLALLAGAVLLVSCDLFGDDDDAFGDWDSKEKSMTIEFTGGGGLGYGQTYVEHDEVELGTPRDLTFRLVNHGGVPIRFWGVTDITDRGHQLWHQGSISITNITNQHAFQLNPGQIHEFTVRMDASQCDGEACVARQYQIEVGIGNKDAIAPNPFVFRVLFTVE